MPATDQRNETQGLAPRIVQDIVTKATMDKNVAFEDLKEIAEVND